MKHIKLFENFESKSCVSEKFKDSLKRNFSNEYDQILDVIMNDYHSFRDANDVLEKINKIIGGYGVEAVKDEDAFVDKYWFDCIAIYINMSDTYIMTILYDTENEKFECTSWGDFYENYQNQKE